MYNIAEKIHLGILGDIKKLDHLGIFLDDKFDILYIDKRLSLYEIHTINHIKSFCDNMDQEIYILYIHTKGVRNVGNKDAVKSWRNMMEYFLNYNNSIEKNDQLIQDFLMVLNQYFLNYYNSLKNFPLLM